SDAILEKAKALFAAGYGAQCDPTLPGGEARGDPEEHVIHYSGTDGGDKAARLFRFFCSAGAYNESAVYYLSPDADALRQVQFATPELDIRYENADNQEKVEAISVIGYLTDEQLANSSYDDATQSITS